MIKYSHLATVAWSITWRFLILLPFLTVVSILLLFPSPDVVSEPSSMVYLVFCSVFYLAIYLSLLWMQKRGSVLLVPVERDYE